MTLSTCRMLSCGCHEAMDIAVRDETPVSTSGSRRSGAASPTAVSTVPSNSIVVGLIGAGIQASRTPFMHEREAIRLGLRYVYKLIDLDRLGLDASGLDELVLAAERLGFSGLNITHPCKQAAIRVVDTLSPTARPSGPSIRSCFGTAKSSDTTRIARASPRASAVICQTYHASASFYSGQAAPALQSPTPCSTLMSGRSLYSIALGIRRGRSRRNSRTGMAANAHKRLRTSAGGSTADGGRVGQRDAHRNWPSIRECRWLLTSSAQNCGLPTSSIFRLIPSCSVAQGSADAAS